MKIFTSFFSLLILTYSTQIFSQVSDYQKSALLYYYSVDQDTKDKYGKIETYLNNPDNLNKCQQCAASAQMLYIAKQIMEKNSLMLVEGILSLQMTIAEIKEFRTKYMSDFKADLKDADGIDNYKWDSITFPELSKTKGSREFYISSISTGMSKKEIFENMNTLYRGEADLIIDAVKKSTEMSEFMYTDRIVSICYEHFYRQDCLEKLKERMYDVKKYAENDLVFCKSQILKAIENEVQNTSEYTINTWSADRNLSGLAYQNEIKIPKEGIYVGFDLTGNLNSSARVEFEYRRPDGTIHSNRSVMSFEKEGMFSGRMYLSFSKNIPVGTWKIFVFIDGNKIAEANFKLKE
jgi:hypothetical protein